MDELIGMLILSVCEELLGWLLLRLFTLLMRRWSLLVIGVLLTISGMVVSLLAHSGLGVGLILAGLLLLFVALCLTQVRRKSQQQGCIYNPSPAVTGTAMDMEEAPNPYQHSNHSFFEREEKPQNLHQFD